MWRRVVFGCSRRPSRPGAEANEVQGFFAHPPPPTLLEKPVVSRARGHVKGGGTCWLLKCQGSASCQETVFLRALKQVAQYPSPVGRGLQPTGLFV